ncbi:MAG: PLP-dependent aminotransferase family protein [Mucilaginibacter sp.]|uniref:MocR-like pyridoxine biosynthesis transcription factor PdxR n=1 Tax=Mucilaginibacter sp. L3T2-6 TaxID=3062491 RepID=UPI00267747A7|nr:PLP-dependent aminotransferase family protein [Mucilaginibacter sp. L3T2-6]MDO3644765.1 PLP-dependent aminotransferase family protein [Mucilaginibacter sp. L3T2-6]MDV6217199.1 PLP-dependent aminotransferase family protein [Mucilaginibacter sp. L3T2-6]
MQFPKGLITIDKHSQVPVYLQIANCIISHIRRGTLKPSSALPGSRVLGEYLGVHRNTVVAAYDELYAQSWVDVYPRRGIFVAKNLPEVSPRKITDAMQPYAYPAETLFDVQEDNTPFANTFVKSPESNLIFNDGFPDIRLAPIELMVREYRRFANYHFTSKYLMYGPEQGSENLRTELARFFRETRGLQVTSENILITKGVQMALYLIARVLLKKGDTFIAGEPGYTGASEILSHIPAKLETVPVDEYGIKVDAIEAICKAKKVRLVYVIPHHHNPTTVTLSADRRMQLLELARKYKFAIVEDDYDYDFHYASSPILPLASVDNYGSVIYVGSFSKTIAPGIRLGFMAAPQNFIRQATRIRRMIDRQGEQLIEEAMANLLKNGDIGRHLKKANKIYHARRDILCGLLKERLNGHVKFKVPDGGFAVWVEYLNGVKPAAVAARASVMGLTISYGRDYYHDAAYPNYSVRLGFASLNEKELEQAVDILKKAILSVIENKV